MITHEVLAFIQQGFPLSPRPYAEIAREIGGTEHEVFTTIQQLRDDGIIRRLGASYAAKRLGYLSMLAAAEVDPTALDSVAEAVNNYAEVTHNYARSGHLNLWFTIIARDAERMTEVLNAVRVLSGVRLLHALPMRRMFKLNVAFAFGTTTPTPRSSTPSATFPCPITDIDKRLIARTCLDLDTSLQPFKSLANELGLTENDMLVRLQTYRECGILRRFGAMLRHQRAGYTVNGLSVWDVPAEHVAMAGERLAACPEISHCYERERVSDWPYNIYAMIHGHSIEECASLYQQLARAITPRSHDLLFSTLEYKKSSMIYFPEMLQQ